MAMRRGEPVAVRDETAVCEGSEADPHPPRILRLPLVAPVLCPACGRPYRRAIRLTFLTKANWPAPE
jgi:uncharacterized Zn-finger protein